MKSSRRFFQKKNAKTAGARNDSAGADGTRLLYAVIQGIESRLDDPELQQAVQLPLTHRMTALNATARE
jgi:hypothetical protein